MRIVRGLRGWLFGCRSTLTWYCTLDRGHDGRHEAWTCTCAGDGRCADEPGALVTTWA